MEHSWFTSSPLELARQLEAMAARLVAGAEAVRRAVAEASPPAPSQPLQCLLSIQELAERLGVSRSAIYSLRYEGQGPPFVRIGNQVRYQPEAVDTWLRERTENGRR